MGCFNIVYNSIVCDFFVFSVIEANLTLCLGGSLLISATQNSKVKISDFDF